MNASLKFFSVCAEKMCISDDNEKGPVDCGKDLCAFRLKWCFIYPSHNLDAVRLLPLLNELFWIDYFFAIRIGSTERKLRKMTSLTNLR